MTKYIVKQTVIVYNSIFSMEIKPERKPKDFSNGKIYCIRNTIDDNIYVGCTCQSLSKRMAYHRGDAKKANKQNTLIYPLM